MNIDYARIGRRRSERGQTLVETGIVIVLLVTMLLGIVEFGRMLMLTNMVVHAARDGARIAAVLPAASYSQAEQHVRDLLGTSVDSVGVTVVPATDAGGITTVTVTVTGNIPYIFPGWWGPSLAIARSVTFRSET